MICIDENILSKNSKEVVMPFFLKSRVARYVIVLNALMFCCSSIVFAKDIKDMVGRNVSVPDVIKTVYAASPPETMLVYALDPNLLAGLNFPIKGRCDKYVAKHALNLPVVGGYFGQGKTPNLEKLVKMNPDVVIGRKSNSQNDKLESFLNKFNMPLAYVVIDELRQYPEAFKVAGEILGRKERAEVLSEYTLKTLAQVDEMTSAIPEQKRSGFIMLKGTMG